MNVFSPSSRNMIMARLATSRGFSLVSAIFLLVVLATLGAAIVSISTSQHTSSALDLQGERAYQAARAGIEWGLYQHRVNAIACPAGSIQLAGATLGAFAVTVTCNLTLGPPSNAGIDLTRRTITSTACSPAAGGTCPNTSPGTNYVERIIQVQF